MVCPLASICAGFKCASGYVLYAFKFCKALAYIPQTTNILRKIEIHLFIIYSRAPFIDGARACLSLLAGTAPGQGRLLGHRPDTPCWWGQYPGQGRLRGMCTALPVGGDSPWSGQASRAWVRLLFM